MAYVENVQTITLEAGADLSSSQYHFVELTSTGATVTNASGELPIGVLQNDPDAVGKAAEVAYAGVTKVVAGGALTRADRKVMTDAQGRAVNWVTGNHCAGVWLEAASAAGEIVPMLLLPIGVD